SDIPGLDVAGTIDGFGASVHNWKIGDRVCAILTGGGYAEFCVAPSVQVLPIPEGWSAIEAATLPENMFTVYDNLITRAGLRRGETALVHGGTSGIGCMYVVVSGVWVAMPIAIAGREERCDACRAFGAGQAIINHERDRPAVV